MEQPGPPKVTLVTPNAYGEVSVRLGRDRGPHIGLIVFKGGTYRWIPNAKAPTGISFEARGFSDVEDVHWMLQALVSRMDADAFGPHNLSTHTPVLGE